MIIGIDPGLRHTGWCVIDEDGKPVARGTIVPPGRGRIQPHEVLNVVLPALDAVVTKYRPDYAVVEQVAWYGSSKRITLPLSHVAGGIAGYCTGLGCDTYLLLAAQKTFSCQRKGWTEHERDAYVLATVVRKHLVAAAAGERSAHPSRSAVARRKITVDRSAHGKR